MKSLARSYIWWPNMDKEIEEVVKSCHSCLEVHTMSSITSSQTIEKL